jgi:hypothetical protein
VAITRSAVPTSDPVGGNVAGVAALRESPKTQGSSSHGRLSGGGSLVVVVPPGVVVVVDRVVVVVEPVVVVVDPVVVVVDPVVVVVDPVVVVVDPVVVVVVPIVVVGVGPSTVKTLLSVKPEPSSTTSIFHTPGGALRTLRQARPALSTSGMVYGP